MIVLLCKHPAVKKYDLSSLQQIMSGAAPLSGELTSQLVQLLPKCWIGQAYGMTETCTTVTMVPITQWIGTPGSGGQLIPGCTARVVKTDGTLADYDEEGELVEKVDGGMVEGGNDEDAVGKGCNKSWEVF